MSTDLITADRLREIFRYRPEDGLFEVLVRRHGSKHKVGDLVRGTLAGKSGHVVLRIDHKLYLAHRLAWLYMTGQWPDQEIDHADRDGSNNAWSNLRASTSALNKVNRVCRKQKYHSLPRGVVPKNSRFQAKVTINGKSVSLGTFDTPEEAGAAYLRMASERYGSFLPKEISQ